MMGRTAALILAFHVPGGSKLTLPPMPAAEAGRGPVVSHAVVEQGPSMPTDRKLTPSRSTFAAGYAMKTFHRRRNTVDTPVHYSLPGHDWRAPPFRTGPARAVDPLRRAWAPRKTQSFGHDIQG